MKFQLYLISIVLSAALEVASHQVVEMIIGSVAANQFTYYSLNKAGRVVITLIPRKGDPDLYIAENGSEPDFHLENHSYQSATCGIERVIIPKHANRPIGIGVFGHPSQEWSAYELQVKIDDDSDDEPESDLLLSEEDMKIEFADAPINSRSIDPGDFIRNVLELLFNILEFLG